MKLRQETLHGSDDGAGCGRPCQRYGIGHRTDGHDDFLDNDVLWPVDAGLLDIHDEASIPTLQNFDGTTPRKEPPMAEEITVAAQQLRAFVERIERLQEERKTIAADIAEVFKELESTGFDKAATKAILKIRQADDGLAVWSERSATVALYLTALGMAPAPARARENIEQFPARVA